MNDSRSSTPFALSHAQALRVSSRIAANIQQMYKRKSSIVQPQAVIKTLNDAGIKFTLMGAHAIAGWLDEPRATQDVDVLIHSRHPQAVRAVKKAFPDLTVEDLPAVTRFVDSATKLRVIDLMKAQAALYKAVPKHVHQVGKTYRIPNLNMALVLKYAAMMSPTRTLKKQRLDEADFIGMVKHNHEIIDRDELARLAELAKTGGGAEILRMVENASQDRPVRP